ncbi:MAG: dihydroorotate dehydrogenase electron transfer subunit [Nanoarchaeota archaeon]|nr:dihydroorotate dehydrogenase electron transfer subunit [Nanoarchaeota archaeon]MBU4124026.1 dihydroorotate dehydrogenase electron transfer subunit [Nanoarchaeota archaeon]
MSNKAYGKRIKIKETILHNPYYKTFIFNSGIGGFDFHFPGQFVMVHLPGVGEKPISISSSEIGQFSITVEKKGPFTEELFKLVKEDSLYVRGPYGDGHFGHLHQPGLGIAGGCGIAPILAVANSFAGCHNSFRILYGAKDKHHLLFDGPEETEVQYATDDGSFGYHGFITDLITKELVEEYDQFFVCGPEKMMKTTAEKIVEYGVDPKKIELSLERYMKCGEGICGSCEVSGRRICVDGPVFNYDEILKMPDFGNYKRDRSGAKAKI